MNAFYYHLCKQLDGFMTRKVQCTVCSENTNEDLQRGSTRINTVFIDQEKALAMLPGEVLWYFMRRSGMAEKYKRVAEDIMCNGSMTAIKCVINRID